MHTAHVASPEETIRQFIRDVFFVETFEGDDSFLEQGIIDSTGMLELVTFLEASYGLKIADEELIPENLDSLNRVLAFLERKQVG